MIKIAGEISGLQKVLWYYNIMPESSYSPKIICPFHEDVNPSMIIDYDRQSWYCFGCNLSGDAPKFVRLMEQREGDSLNDLQAYQVYMQIVRSPKASDVVIKSATKRVRPPDADLHNEAWDYYYGLKSIDWLSVDDEDAISAAEYMRVRGFTYKALNKCGAKVNYSRSYGLIFPMLDNGDFKGWVCRTMIKEVEAKRKYLYNEGFSRATTLVGNYGKQDFVIVTEGYMDRLKFLQYGYNNVVAILGWKMSDQQIKKLKSKGIKRIISALDNDVCGRKGTKYLAGFFEVTRWQYLKGLKDPGDMTKSQFLKMYKRTMQIYKNKGVNGNGIVG